MSGSGSRVAFKSAGRASSCPVFPSATQTLRKRPRRLVRRIGVPAKRCLNAASSSAAFAGKPVPGANFEAVVAAEDARAHRGTEFDGDAAFQLDREVGDAEPRIEFERRGDGARRARRDAARARAAAVALGRVGLQLQRGEDFGEEEPVAEGAVDEVRVFADEAGARALRKVAFEHGTGVHIPQRACAGAAERVHERGEFSRPLAEHVVVIAEPRVTGDDAGPWVAGLGFRLGAVWRGLRARNLKPGRRNCASVAGDETDHGPRALEHALRLDPFRRVAREVAHVAVASVGDPPLEVRRARGRSRRGEAAVVEAEFERPRANGVLHPDFSRAWRNCNSTCCATSRMERDSVLMSRSACL